MDHSLSICVVDDDPNITELLEDHFRYCDIDCAPVATFNDPEQAILYLDEHPATDVTITDFHMGRFSGVDVIQHAPKSSLTILISGHITQQEINAIQEPNLIFFDKPVSMKQIDAAIKDFSNRQTA